MRNKMPVIEEISLKDLNLYSLAAKQLTTEYGNTLRALQQKRAELSAIAVTTSIFIADVARLSKRFDQEKTNHVSPFIFFNLEKIIARHRQLCEKYKRLFNGAKDKDHLELKIALTKSERMIQEWQDYLVSQNAEDDKTNLEFSVKQKQISRQGDGKKVELRHTLDFSAYNVDEEDIKLADDYFDEYSQNLADLYAVMEKKFQLGMDFLQQMKQVVTQEQKQRRGIISSDPSSKTYPALEKFGVGLDSLFQSYMMLFVDKSKLVLALSKFTKEVFYNNIEGKLNRSHELRLGFPLGVDHVALLICAEKSKSLKIEPFIAILTPKHQDAPSTPLEAFTPKDAQLKDLEEKIMTLAKRYEDKIAKLTKEIEQVQQVITANVSSSNKAVKNKILEKIKSIYEDIIKKYTLITQVCSEVNKRTQEHAPIDLGYDVRGLLDRFSYEHLSELWSSFEEKLNFFAEQPDFQDTLTSFVRGFKGQSAQELFLYLPSELFFMRGEKIYAATNFAQFIKNQIIGMAAISLMGQKLSASTLADTPIADHSLFMMEPLPGSARLSFISICFTEDASFIVGDVLSEEESQPLLREKKPGADIRPARNTDRFSVLDSASLHGVFERRFELAALKDPEFKRHTMGESSFVPVLRQAPSVRPPAQQSWREGMVDPVVDHGTSSSDLSRTAKKFGLTKRVGERE